MATTSLSIRLPRAARSLAGCLGVALLAAACSDSSAPAPAFVGHYTLLRFEEVGPLVAGDFCRLSFHPGRLTVTPDSASFQLDVSDQVSDPWMISGGPYVRSADGRELVVTPWPNTPGRDTVGARGFAVAYYRTDLPLPPSCGGYAVQRVDLVFMRD